MKIENIKPENLRDILHNLDYTDNKKFYDSIEKDLMGFFEGIIPEVYTDEVKLATIGIGFNMEQDKAKELWDKAFNKKLDFDTYKASRKKLSKEEIDILYEYMSNEKYNGLKKIFPEIDQLRLNERMAIFDLYYNGGNRLFGEDKRIYAHMKNYVHSKDRRYLELAVDEIRYRSNGNKLKGIEIRRKYFATLLESYNAPMYTKPGEPLLSNKRIEAKINSTIVPRGLELQEGDSDYFVWRTMLDDKVRKEHLAVLIDI